MPVILVDYDGFYGGLLQFIKACDVNGTVGAKGAAGPLRRPWAPPQSVSTPGANESKPSPLHHTQPPVRPALPTVPPPPPYRCTRAELRDLIVAADNEAVLDVLREVGGGREPWSGQGSRLAGWLAGWLTRGRG